MSKFTGRYPGRFNNPYFKARPFAKPRFLYNLLIILFTVLGWAYFLFFSAFFKIDNLEINGLENYEKSGVREAAESFVSSKKFFILAHSNIFLFNDHDLRQFLTGKYAFESITAQKYYPKKIILTFKEKDVKDIVVSNGMEYAVSDDATVVSKKRGVVGCYKDSRDKEYATSTNALAISDITIGPEVESRASSQGLYIFCDANNVKEVPIGGRYPGYQSLRVMNDFLDSMRNRTELKPKLSLLAGGAINPKIVLFLDSGWKIYLSESEEGSVQFYKFFLIYNEKVKKNAGQMEYIDMRFGDRVYVK